MEEFLTIDHIKGDGSEHRMVGLNKNAKHLYAWLAQQGFPKDAFRLLCFQCNYLRGRRGACPHKPDDVQIGFSKATDNKAIYAKQYRTQLMTEVFYKYGSECSCCGDRSPSFLTLKKIGVNNQREASKELKAGIYVWVRDNGYPPDFYLLCLNCNWSKSRWGYCPHQASPEERCEQSAGADGLLEPVLPSD